MLDKKLAHDINSVNHTMTEEGIPSSDQNADVIRSFVKDATRFENAIDRIIASGKKEGKEMFRIFGK